MQNSSTSTPMMLAIDEIAEIFEDLTPIAQVDGPDPVCAIQYPTGFVIAYDYMRACWKKGEKSERSLKLSGTCVKLNPANYTIWHYRRQCLASLGKLFSKEDIDAELTFTALLGGTNPKNYQIWYHRRALLEEYGRNTSILCVSNEICPSLEADFMQSELDYISEVLDEDSKNYHAWSHRQWFVSTINTENIWEHDEEYAEEKIRQDPRNNSAWNERWFAVHRAIPTPLPIALCQQEADFAIDHGAKLDPYNDSPFRYLIALLDEQTKSMSEKNKSITDLYSAFYTKVEGLRDVLVQAQRNPEACCSWTACRVDLLEGMGDRASIEQAIALANGLANEYDRIRKKYWLLRVDQLHERLQNL